MEYSEQQRIIFNEEGALVRYFVACPSTGHLVGVCLMITLALRWFGGRMPTNKSTIATTACQGDINMAYYC